MSKTEILPNENSLCREHGSDGEAKNEHQVKMTQEQIAADIARLEAKGRVAGTLEIYRRGLKKLFEYLLEEKQLTKEVLQQWRLQLQEEGYNINTINSFLVVADVLLVSPLGIGCIAQPGKDQH